MSGAIEESDLRLELQVAAGEVHHAVFDLRGKLARGALHTRTAIHDRESEPTLSSSAGSVSERITGTSPDAASAVPVVIANADLSVVEVLPHALEYDGPEESRFVRTVRAGREGEFSFEDLDAGR